MAATENSRQRRLHGARAQGRTEHRVPRGTQTAVFPLLWNILGFDYSALLVVQVLLAAAAWLTLASQTCRVFRTAAVRVAAFAIVLLVGLSTQVMIWNGIPGTDSLSISLMCFALAAAIAWALAPRSRVLPAALVRCGGAVGVHPRRQRLLPAPGRTRADRWFVTARVRGRDDPSARPHPRWLVIPAALVLVFALNYASSEHGRRWEYPLYNVLIYRVLPDKDRTHWFVEHGMPAAEVRAVERRAYEQGRDFEKVVASPDVRRLRRWIDTEGRSAYAEYLVTHPGYTLDAFRSRVDDQFTSHGVEEYGLLWSYAPPPGNVLSDIVYPHDGVLVLVWGVFAAIALGFVWYASARRDRRWIAALGVAVVVNVIVFAIVWAADPNEIGRHEMGPAIAMRYLLWFATLFAVDRLVQFRLRRLRRVRGAEGSERAAGDQFENGSSELATTHIEKYCADAPYAWASATFAPSTWCSPAMPRTCSAASAKRSSPDAPMGFDDSTPPDMFTGNEPSSAVSPRSTIFQPSLWAAMSWASSHIGSYQLNGT